MPKRKANWWPPSILSDPDVLSVDDEGRFVLCKICHVHYAVHGGKKPKPVIMNSNFRTRAWDVHKERTNSHRLQKQQERLQQAKLQVQQGQAAQATDTQGQQPAPEQRQQAQPKRPQQAQGQQVQKRKGQSQPSQTQAPSQTLPVLASQVQTRPQAQPLQALAPPAHEQPPQAPVQPHSGTQVLQQRRQQQDQQQQQQRQQQDLEETTGAGKGRLQVAARNSANERPASAAPEAITAATTSGTTSTHDGGRMNSSSSSSSKRPPSTMPIGAPAPRRRVFRAGSPGSSRQLIAESEAPRRAAAHTFERHSFMAPGTGNHAKKTAPSEHTMAMEQQADSSARWRHMHDDVSRALNAAPRRRQQGPASYTSGELRAAKTLAQTETGDLGGNNSERVAKKLRSLNAEYHASNMRHADAYNMRHTDILDRRSAGYKEYWGTLRDVYTSSGTGSGGTGTAASHRKSPHRSNPSAKPAQEESKETEADSTTPDDSGSSEDAFKPAVVVHDASLINAIERLTDVTSKQIASLCEKETTGTKEALAGLTSVMTDLRVQHGQAFGRMIELHEKHLKVMEGILEIKLRKEAARNARSSCINNENTSGGSSGSGPGSSTSGDGGASSQCAECGIHAQSG